MTLSQLKYVITVAEEKSMNEAAKKLFVAQPSLYTWFGCHSDSL